MSRLVLQELRPPKSKWADLQCSDGMIRSPKGVVGLEWARLVGVPVQAVHEVGAGGPLDDVVIAQLPPWRQPGQILGDCMHDCQIDWIDCDIDGLGW